MNRDRHGIIGQIQPDGSIEGGDSACWMGHWLYLNDGKCPDTDWDASKFIKEFEVSFGAYVRHPDPSLSYDGFAAYYKNPWDGVISRDQYHGVLAAIIAAKDYSALFRAFLHHGAWAWLFMYNTRINGQNPSQAKWKMPDLTLFDMWALYIRGAGLLGWLFYPLLTLFDVHLFLSTVFVNMEPKEKDDVINHTIKMIIAKDKKPTLFSWLAWKVLNKEKLMEKLKIYWCGWRDGCEIVKKYEERVRG